MDLIQAAYSENNLRYAMSIGMVPTVESLAVLALHREYKDNPAYYSSYIFDFVRDLGNQLMLDMNPATNLPRGRNDAKNVAIAVACNGLVLDTSQAEGSEYQVTGGDESSGALYVTIPSEDNQQSIAVTAAYNVDVSNLGNSNPILSKETERKNAAGESAQGRSRTDGLMQRHTQFLRASFRSFIGQPSTFNSADLPVPEWIKNQPWDGSAAKLEDLRKSSLSVILASNLRNGAACFYHPKGEYSEHGLTGQGSIPGIQLAEDGTTLDTLEQSVKKGKKPLSEGGIMLAEEDRRKLINGEELTLPDGTKFTLSENDPFYQYIQTLDTTVKEKLIQTGIQAGDLPDRYIADTFPQAEVLPATRNAADMQALESVSPDNVSVQGVSSDVEQWGRVMSYLIKKNYEQLDEKKPYFKGSPFDEGSEFNTFLNDFGQLAALIHPLNKHLAFAEDIAKDSQQFNQPNKIAYGFAKVYGFGNTNKYYGLDGTNTLRDELVERYQTTFKAKLNDLGVDEDYVRFYDKAGNRKEESSTFTYRLAIPSDVLAEAELDFNEIVHQASVAAQEATNKFVKDYGFTKTPSAKEQGLPGTGITSTVMYHDSRNTYPDKEAVFDTLVKIAFERLEALEKSNTCLDSKDYSIAGSSEVIKRPNNDELSDEDLAHFLILHNLHKGKIGDLRTERSSRPVKEEDVNIFKKLCQCGYQAAVQSVPLFKNAIAIMSNANDLPASELQKYR